MKEKIIKLSRIIVVFILTISLLFTGSYVHADNEKVISTWAWSDGNETIQYEDEKWQTEKEISDLPETILAIVENKQETVSVSWSKEENIYQATIEEGYVLEDGTDTISVYPTDVVETVSSEETETQEDTDTSYLNSHIVTDTVSPEGTNINLFDYWIAGDTEADRFTSDNTKYAYGNTNNATDRNGKANNASKDYLNTGINKTHYTGEKWTGTVAGTTMTEDIADRGVLKFTHGADDLHKSYGYFADNYNNKGGKINDGRPLSFISSVKDFSSVYRNLENGYPRLSVTNMDAGDWAIHWPSNETNLDYLFNPKIDADGKKSFSNVKGLLQTDSNGYFTYNSQQNFAEFDEETNNFTLYDKGGVQPRNGTHHPYDDHDLNGQFFPFNKATDVFSGEDANGLVQKNVNCTDASLNHYFGLTLTSRFIHKNGGKNTKNEPIEFDFAGDDDVWVFIDGVLVADLGGAHERASLSIDFSTGDITLKANKYNMDSSTWATTPVTEETRYSTLKEQFQKAANENGTILDDSMFSGDTFADNTYHTLKFFYLERGNYVSNLELKYNLVTVPQSTIKKIDESGTGLEGATFSLYEADKNYKVEEGTDPLCTGTTDEYGEYILRDSDDQLISLDQLRQQNKRYFVLREEKVPTGYRKTGQEIHLELKDISSGNAHVKGAYFRTANKAQCGVKARSNGTITVSDSFEYYDDFYDGNTIEAKKVENYSKEKDGLVVAVPVKYIGDKYNKEKTIKNLRNIYNWAPVSGNSLDGYKVLERKIEGNDTQTGEDPLINMVKVAKENKSIAELTTDGSYKMKIDDLPGLVEDYFQYQLGKYKDDHNLEEVDDNVELNEVYFSVIYIFVRGTTDIDKATTDGDKNTFFISTNNTFEREYSTSIIVFNKQNKVRVQKVDTLGNLITEPATFALYKAEDVENDQVKDGAKAVKENIVTSDGEVEVTDLETGVYYLKETQAPSGYEATKQLVKINVTEPDVFVNAGEENDDVDVVMNIGHAVKTYYHYVKGELDLLMRDIKATLKTSNDLVEWTEHKDKVGYFSYNMDQELNESQYDFVPKGKEISEVASKSTIDSYPEGFCYKSGYGTLEMNLWYEPDSGKKLNASNLGTEGENTSLKNLFNNISVIRVRNKKKETYYLQKNVAADIEELENVEYTTENEKIKYANNEWTASETGTYETTVTKNGESVAVTFHVYDVKDNIYVLDYGLKAKLADGTQGKALKDGIFSDDELSIANNETSNKVTSIGEGTSISVSGDNGTLTADELEKDAYGTTITYEPTKFMDSEDEFKVTTQVQSGDGEFRNHYNGIEMEENVTVLPASVVYYEDNFAGSSTTEDNSGKPIVYKNATSGDTKVTTNSVSIDNTYQSIDQLENYGFDEAYKTVGEDANGSTTLGKFCSMTFEFKGKGFDLVGRSSKDSGRILVSVKKKDGDEWKAYKSYVRDLSYEDSEENAALYRLPIFSCQDLAYDNYQVTVVVMTSTASNGTLLYLDGIRIYHPLDDESKYAEKEQETKIEKLRTLILGGETSLDAENAKVAVVNYESDGKASTLGGTITEDRGFVPSETNDLERYLNVGPKEEVYIRKNSGIAFRVKPDEGKSKDDITLQVEAKLVDTNGSSNSGTLINASVTENKNIEVKSTSGMYYTVLLGEAKTDGSYLVVLANTTDNDISLTNVKYKNCTLEMPKAGDDLNKTNVVEPTDEDTNKVLAGYSKENTNGNYKVSSASMNQNYMTSGAAGYINVTYKVRKEAAIKKEGAPGETINDYVPPVPELYVYDGDKLNQLTLEEGKDKDYWQVGAQEIVETEQSTTTTERVSYLVYSYRIKVTPAASGKQFYAVGATVGSQKITEPKVLGSEIRETAATVSVENGETEAIVTLKLAEGIRIVAEEEKEWEEVSEERYEKRVRENGKYQVHVEDEEAVKGIEDPISQVKALDYEVQLKTKGEDDNSKEPEEKGDEDSKEEIITKEIEMIEGSGSSWKEGEDGLVFRSNAEYEDFIKVLVDGKEISKENYTVRKGSTIVELHRDYLRTLSKGKHTIEIVSKTGTAKATFTVESEPTSVSTGDDSRIVLFGCMLILSCMGFVVYRKVKARD